MTGAQTRTLIATLLRDLRRPMTSPEIAELLRMRFGVDVSTLSIGSNLGYLRVGGLVDRRSCLNWNKPYWRDGQWHFSTENWWWHTEVVSKETARKFLMSIRLEAERKLREFQRGRGRPVTRKLQPRTDDMRQMLVDIGRV